MHLFPGAVCCSLFAYHAFERPTLFFSFKIRSYAVPHGSYFALLQLHFVSLSRQGRGGGEVWSAETLPKARPCPHLEMSYQLEMHALQLRHKCEWNQFHPYDFKKKERNTQHLPTQQNMFICYLGIRNWQVDILSTYPFPASLWLFKGPSNSNMVF